MISRRDAMKGVAAGIVAVGLSSTARAATADGVTFGVIGCGGRGRGHVRLLAGRKDTRVAYVCDPDAQRAEAAAVDVEKATGMRPKVVADPRRVFDDPDVDAVTVATPDHWHAPATILACRAGKHVYVEKPCSHNVREGRLMVEAAREYDRVVQVGTQARNTKHVRRAIALLEEGAIGEVLVAKAWNSQRRANIGHGKPTKPPAHLDYDMWLGPAPDEPNHANRLHYNWHWRYAFGTGDMGNDGAHELDLALWGLGVDGRHAESVTANGRKLFFDDDQQFPDTQHVVFDFAPAGPADHRRQLIFEQRIWTPYRMEGYENGNAFYGTKGFLLLGKNDDYRLYGERNKLVEEAGIERTTDTTSVHYDDFLRCLADGTRPRADIELGHHSAAACHLGNIASRLRRSLFFDAESERFVGDDEANALLSREYRRDHWASLG